LVFVGQVAQAGIQDEHRYPFSSLAALAVVSLAKQRRLIQSFPHLDNEVMQIVRSKFYV